MLYNNYNPYLSGYSMTGNINPSPQSAMLPHQQIIQVNGKSSVDTIQLAPNSSVLVMDTSAPIVWMCVSDGVGKVTSTPYDITVHQEKPLPDVTSFEQRIDSLEKLVKELEVKVNAESNATRTKSKSFDSNNQSD